MEPVPAPEPQSDTPAVDRPTLERKLRGTWAEYLSLKDVTEAVECCKEFAHPEHNAKVCKMLIIDKLMEAKASQLSEQSDLLCKLFAALIQGGVVKPTEVEAG
jgi:hypothetical protein